MIKVSEAYKKASSSSTRKSYLIAKYGLYNKKAKGEIESVQADNQAFSNLSKLYNEIKDTRYNYVSCEPNRVNLGGSYYFLNDKQKSNASEQLAYWSSVMSNANGLFASNPTILISFAINIDFTDITLYFSEVCRKFIVRYYLNKTLIHTNTISENEKLVVETTPTTRASTYFDEIEIEFVQTKDPYRYIKLLEIDFGVLKTFTKYEIEDINVIDELSIDSSKLPSNSLVLSVEDENGEYDILNPNNKLSLLQERQEIAVYHYLDVNGSYVEVPIGTFLLKNFDYSDKTLRIEAYDDIYFMNKTYYGSKFYENAPIKTILEDLFNYFNYTRYIIDEELDGITLSGYVPIVEFREALRLIAEAGGCVVNKNRYGQTYIFSTYDDITTKNFETKEITSPRPKRNLFNNVIDVIEYNYTNKSTNQEIYNATLSVGTHQIIFTKPIIETSVVKGEVNSNYTINKTSATSCEVIVTSETNVILKGTIVNVESSLRRIVKEEAIVTDDYAITSVDNKLITSNNYNKIGNWKLGRNDVRLDFETLSKPYIEVGDTCYYQTPYNYSIKFIPTRLEFTKSIFQRIEGE